MGIKHLFQLISENAPNAVINGDIKQYFGRKVAIDASMCLYSFLIAVRSDGQQLTSDTGDVTSHLMGMFYRTVRMVDNGIKPLYIFDGAPPTLKSGELAKRSQRKAEAAEAVEEAKETGTAEDVEKFARRAVRVTREHNEECQKLLRLMGIPYMIAPTEAEAQCATLARMGKVYAAASEDMDTLTFNSPILLRHLTFSEQRKEPIQEIHLKIVLESLDMELTQFVDLCILLGCDYVEPIKGIGPSTALKLIREHKNLETVIKHLQSAGNKYKIPDDWPYAQARQLFLQPQVIGMNNTDDPLLDFQWNGPDTEALVEFMVGEKGFAEDRIRASADKLAKNLRKAHQSRLDGFFAPLQRTEEQQAATKKRLEAKLEERRKRIKESTKARREARGKGRAHKV